MPQATDNPDLVPFTERPTGVRTFIDALCTRDQPIPEGLRAKLLDAGFTVAWEETPATTGAYWYGFYGDFASRASFYEIIHGGHAAPLDRRPLPPPPARVASSL